jgi:hypothetical protein
MSRKLIAILLSLFVVILSACQSAPAPAASGTPTRAVQRRTRTPTEASLPTETPAPTSSSSSSVTATPADVNQPSPTNTPFPTFTPPAPGTPTPTPKPIIIIKSGPAVQDVNKWKGPAILQIKYTGGINFALWNYDANGKTIDILVNTLGNYAGTIPLDFVGNEQTARLQISAPGHYEITILPLSSIRHVTVPGTFNGTGDDVVLLDGPSVNTLKFDASQAKMNFTLTSYFNGDLLPLVQTIAPNTGSVTLREPAPILVIHTQGNWSIEASQQ